MMRYLLLFLPILFDIEISHAQIPNGGFELWEEVLNYEKPIGWITNQDTITARFEKDTISVEGDYSLKIIPGGVHNMLDKCESMARTLVEFEPSLPSNSILSFYAKMEAVDSAENDGVYLRIKVDTYDGDTHLSAYQWYTFTGFQHFTKVEISLKDENANKATIFIFGGGAEDAYDGPCINRSFSWVDGMAIESGTNDQLPTIIEIPIISVYPNPSNGFMHINHENGKDLRYELYSLLGELVSYGRIENNELTIYNQGIYILKLFVGPNPHPVYANKVIVIK